jgi:PAS domain S-box-containing protein
MLSMSDAAFKPSPLPPDGSYRLLFEDNPQPMWVYDLGSLRFLAVNEAAVEHYGYERDEFLGMSLEDIRPAEDVPRLRANVAAGSPGLQHSGTWRHRRKDGSLIDVEITSHLLDWQGHRAKLVVARDVTSELAAHEELVRHAAEIERLNQQLEERVRERTGQLRDSLAAVEAANAELESFSYSVSHDLRAPLRAIAGFARILEENYAAQLDLEGRRLLGVVRDNARHMGQLIDDLLAFSRLTRQELRRAPVDMAALARQVAGELAGGDGRSAAEVDVQPLPPATGDRSLLRQVLTNLLDNALKFSRHAPRPRVEVAGRREDGRSIYSVRDNGVGFDMRHADKLFGVFQRLHAQQEFEGTGVGLALVQRIVQRHGGAVWAESAPGAGATFFFTLPAEESG